MNVKCLIVSLGAFLVAMCVPATHAAEFPGLGQKGTLQRVAFENEAALLLLGANANYTLGDGEVLIIVYNATEGWF